MSPLTPTEAHAIAAILDCHPRRLPHWAGWATRLRDWGNQHMTPSETPSQDGEPGGADGILGVETEAVPEVRKHRGDLTASPRPTRPGGVGL